MAAAMTLYRGIFWIICGFKIMSHKTPCDINASDMKRQAEGI